ncbi:hypothetical protein DQ239_15080 [Blastococcus sp. TF02-09]|uniref:hypothetical protein n=1 Tax=Blastococcus sp. TF02-09 TaxID=2250576 RepID=UPI000DE990A1|nr:hypothetical protein [Blastococcus sp. TF02-9]RBY75850.1 hypothetical protein DQ239_15080 [Blastococcus sp. TF02-9]
MSSSEAGVLTPARGGASPADAGASLAGLIGVLDRADGARPAQRTRPVHTTAFRASARAVPLRPVPPAPAARPGRVPLAAPLRPTVTVVPEPERRPVTGLRDLARRAALWGAGPQGEHVAWRTPEPAPRPPLRPRLRALTRRIALWGAGPRGEHLAWGRPAPVAAPRPVAPPVVLRELPSTPTIRPAASSPAVALIPAPTAPSPRTGPAVLRAPTPVAAARPAPAGPVGPGWTPPPPGWPQPPAWGSRRQAAVPVGRTTVLPPLPAGPRRTVPVPRSATAGARAGPARARGDPESVPAPRPALTAPG